MANTFNYAEKYMPEILDIVDQQALTSPLLTSNVEWLDAQTVHFTSMSTSGYKTRQTGATSFNAGEVTQIDHSYAVSFDRDIAFNVDKKNIIQTGGTYDVSNIVKVFNETEDAPETDAYAFSKISALAVATSGLSQETTLASWTKDNVVTRLIAINNKAGLKLYRARGSVINYVRSEIMDLLAENTAIEKTMDVTTISDSGAGIETRIAKVNGVVLIEVIDQARFNTSFDFTDGFVADGEEINVLALSLQTCKTVKNIDDIFLSEPSAVTGGNYVYAQRSFYDTFVFPNGKTGAIDSIFADTIPAPEE